jgi:hypothetical protein
MTAMGRHRPLPEGPLLRRATNVKKWRSLLVPVDDRNGRKPVGDLHVDPSEGPVLPGFRAAQTRLTWLALHAAKRAVSAMLFPPARRANDSMVRRDICLSADILTASFCQGDSLPSSFPTIIVIVRGNLERQLRQHLLYRFQHDFRYAPGFGSNVTEINNAGHGKACPFPADR